MHFKISNNIIKKIYLQVGIVWELVVYVLFVSKPRCKRYTSNDDLRYDLWIWPQQQYNIIM